MHKLKMCIYTCIYIYICTCHGETVLTVTEDAEIYRRGLVNEAYILLRDDRSQELLVLLKRWLRPPLEATTELVPVVVDEAR